MSVSRRGFLHLLGATGVGIAAATAAPVPLFGSDEVSALIYPDASSISGHVVVQKKGLTEKIPREEAMEIMRNRRPTS